jgi:glucose/mannose-6-phosphate isomerase
MDLFPSSNNLHLYDQNNILSQINGLPGQLAVAWENASRQPLPSIGAVRDVTIAGMGSSGEVADMVCAYVAGSSRLPVRSWQDYDLPAWVTGPDHLVIAISHTGNTEETLSTLHLAQQRACTIMAITTGGALLREANQAGITAWTYDAVDLPSFSPGYGFAYLTSLLHRLDMIPDPGQAFQTAVADLRALQPSIRVETPVESNPAKRLAGQLIGRLVFIFGSGYLAPVSRRWQSQFSRVAKTWAQSEYLPAMNHNMVSGLQYPADLLTHTFSIFLRAPSDHVRNRLRSDLTRQYFMVEGMNTDTFDAPGGSALSHIWTSLHFGDYVAYYLAMMCGIDPDASPVVEGLKGKMKND